MNVTGFRLLTCTKTLCDQQATREYFHVNFSLTCSASQFSVKISGMFYFHLTEQLRVEVKRKEFDELY